VIIVALAYWGFLAAGWPGLMIGYNVAMAVMALALDKRPRLLEVA
jgi:hypothetical protein